MEIPGISRVRRNHAIEHATVAVLFQRRGRVVSVVGRSDQRGFRLFGPFSREEVAAAAEEAITRLRAGEDHLAVSHLCGTNLAVTGTMAGAAALLTVGASRREGWSRALTFSMLAAVLATRVGLWIQRHATTDAAIGEIRLQRVEESGSLRGGRHLRVYLA